MDRRERPSTEPRRRGISRRVWWGAGIVASIVLLVAGTCAAVFVGSVRRRSARSVCGDRLRRIASLHEKRTDRLNGTRLVGGGVPYLLSLWSDELERSGNGYAYLLWAPMDPRGRLEPPADPSNPTPPLGEWSSFGARDFGRFPLEPGTPGHELLAATRWDLYSGWEVIGGPRRGEEGLMVLRLDGSVRWMTRADLGLAPDDPLVIGPESKSPLLRKLCIEPGEPSSPR